ncbi:hypothetical protein DFH27DRAFT_325724 [Peziza echinospora]|nr:hypothetical protein DFH27DRAFT_325724 [Peziza echinospora]
MRGNAEYQAYLIVEDAAVAHKSSISSNTYSTDPKNGSRPDFTRVEHPISRSGCTLCRCIHKDPGRISLQLPTMVLASPGSPSVSRCTRVSRTRVSHARGIRRTPPSFATRNCAYANTAPPPKRRCTEAIPQTRHRHHWVAACAIPPSARNGYSDALQWYRCRGSAAMSMLGEDHNILLRRNGVECASPSTRKKCFGASYSRSCALGLLRGDARNLRRAADGIDLQVVLHGRKDRQG